ncbi:eukaryotic translation initiation factor 4 gamma 3 isoform X6 [Silurus asotus]|uniref:Eukaryotic translation initiation factor 4 gamma 3 isoform X6 n=1 Tax=Silurus asotus TaxID=30991 RepID=A0AAD5B6K0_SILAS|nr:eukaryotic translation initiation factor 4 gamma 3 isoform X6 [Silurus asotus]
MLSAPQLCVFLEVSAAGMFYYNDQAVYNQTPFPMVPPLQQHPSTKRKRKTIVVRDPNQDNKDITEEIISEAGRSRKPTLPVGNFFSVPMPLQDKPELAFRQSDFDLEPVSTTVENSSVSPVIVEHLASAETPEDEIEAQEAEPLNNKPEPSSEDESNDGVLSPVEEPNNTTMHSETYFF